MNPWFKRISAGILLSASIGFVPFSYAESPYTDLATNNAYYEGIASMTTAGVVSGYEDGSFKTNQEVTRAEAVKMILAATSTSIEETGDQPFPDVDPEAWYATYVATAAKQSIVSGAKNGYFYPEHSVNRAEALKMLLLAAHAKVDLLNASDENWYSAYLQYAIDHALLAPDSNGDYSPSASLSRGELCELIYRFKTEPYTNHVEYGIASYYGYSFDGHNTASGTPLDTEGFQAAHPNLPFGTRLRITNINTKASVIVTVVDRGPYTKGYVVDLTPAAFKELGSLSTGIIKVRLEVLK